MVHNNNFSYRVQTTAGALTGHLESLEASTPRDIIPGATRSVGNLIAAGPLRSMLG